MPLRVACVAVLDGVAALKLLVATKMAARIAKIAARFARNLVSALRNIQCPDWAKLRKRSTGNTLTRGSCR